MRTIGIILIIAGIAGFLISDVSFSTTEEVADIGPLEVEREKERSLPITPVASGALIVIGGVVTVMGIRRTRN
ncbi:DUF3185 domain-containing protein [Longimonas halophila]|uniref:DUF3185 domain-containing protein n=1 Tax=Longimonas halophila TaxID=1469170 RepID=A0A2H3P858_9BACT|nr:DUF3185 domain-containing protein [Longimonas halophila]PEN07885.1 DUF3185 domain-containing protein [Longimonas halophila]